MSISKWVSLPFFAKDVDASKQRVRHHARLNLFGTAARRTPEGWQLDLEPARKAWRTCRDLNTAPMSVVIAEIAREKRPTPTPDETDLVMAWDGPGGRYEAPVALARATEAALATEEQLLSPEMVAHLDRLLVAMGLLPRDFECGAPVEAAS